MPAPLVSIVVPCYNEESIIEATADKLLDTIPRCAESFEVIFCNDGSTDLTGAKLQVLQGRHEPIVAVGYPANRGAGYAFREALKIARGRYVIHMDADLAMEPEAICRECLRLLESCDIAIASRYRGTRADYPLRRRLPSMVFRTIYRYLLGLPIQDAMSGFFGLRRSVLDEIPALEMDGFEVYLELFVKARRLGLRIHEFPAKFIHQTESGEISVLARAPRQLLNTLRIWLRWGPSRTFHR